MPKGIPSEVPTPAEALRLWTPLLHLALLSVVVDRTSYIDPNRHTCTNWAQLGLRAISVDAFVGQTLTLSSFAVQPHLFSRAGGVSSLASSLPGQTLTATLT